MGTETEKAYLLEDENLCSNLPPAQLPATEDVGHVVVHAVYEEEVPALEALGEDGHFAEAAARAAAGEEDGSGSFRLDKDLRAHFDARPKLAGDVAKEPVLGDTEAGVFVECLDEEFAVPQGDGAVGERRRANLAGEFTLDTAELVLEILGLLAEVSL